MSGEHGRIGRDVETHFGACLPMGLAWGAAVIAFLKGCAPVLAAFIGLVSVFIGIADIKDKREAMAEEEEAMKAEESK